MDQLSQERRGLFGGLRVPFDLGMLALAFAAVVGFCACVELIEAASKQPDILARMWRRLLPGGGGVASPPPIVWAVTGVVLLAFWTFFATAISRIAAMKIAREESLGVRDAARFAGRKFVPVLSSVVFVAALIAVFYIVCNATVAGGVMRLAEAHWLLSWIDLLAAPLFFLVLISTFLIVLALILGLFGMNLAASAIATESSDTWDGLSRSWNYILVRPWNVLLVYGLTFAYLGIFLLFADRFLYWSVDSLGIGAWGAGDRVVVEKVERADYPKLGPDMQKAFPEKDEKATAHFILPGKVQFYRGYIFGGMSSESVVYYPTDDDRAYLKKLPDDVRRDIRNPNGGINVAALVPWNWKTSAAIVWFWLWIARFVVVAYVVQYFFGAMTMLYFLLRKEVEDEDYAEIVVEEEELEAEAAWEVKEPARPAPGATAPAGGLVMPKTVSSAPPATGGEPVEPAAAPAPPATSTPTSSPGAPPQGA